MPISIYSKNALRALSKLLEAAMQRAKISRDARHTRWAPTVEERALFDNSYRHLARRGERYLLIRPQLTAFQFPGIPPSPGGL
jgi:hypothetical protein